MPAKFHKKRQPFLFGKSKEKSVEESERLRNFKVSFQYLDTTQKYGSSFKDWQKAGLLSKAMETLHGYCCLPLMNQVDGCKFAIYGNFPPVERTKFEYPKNVPSDANWARIHITGKAVIVGHIVNDTFYVVFLDKTHKFYLTKKTVGK